MPPTRVSRALAGRSRRRPIVFGMAWGTAGGSRAPDPLGRRPAGPSSTVLRRAERAPGPYTFVLGLRREPRSDRSRHGVSHSTRRSRPSSGALYEHHSSLLEGHSEARRVGASAGQVAGRRGRASTRRLTPRRAPKPGRTSCERSPSKREQTSPCRSTRPGRMLGLRVALGYCLSTTSLASLGHQDAGRARGKTHYG